MRVISSSDPSLNLKANGRTIGRSFGLAADGRDSHRQMRGCQSPNWSDYLQDGSEEGVPQQRGQDLISEPHTQGEQWGHEGDRCVSPRSQPESLKLSRRISGDNRSAFPTPMPFPLSLTVLSKVHLLCPFHKFLQGQSYWHSHPHMSS